MWLKLSLSNPPSPPHTPSRIKVWCQQPEQTIAAESPTTTRGPLAAPQAMLNYENMDLLMAHMNANAGTEGHTTGGGSVA